MSPVDTCSRVVLDERMHAFGFWGGATEGGTAADTAGVKRVIF